MPEEELSGLFGIHSETDNRPMMRGWAESQADAETLLERIKASDAQPEDDYWIIEMSEAEADCHRAVGLIPQGV